MKNKEVKSALKQPHDKERLLKKKNHLQALIYFQSKKKADIKR